MGSGAQVGFWPASQPRREPKSSPAAEAGPSHGPAAPLFPSGPLSSPAFWRKHTGGLCPLVATGGRASP